MDLDAWLTKAIDAQEKGLALPSYDITQPSTHTATHKRKSGASLDEEPKPKRAKGEGVATSPQSGRAGAGRKARSGAAFARGRQENMAEQQN